MLENGGLEFTNSRQRRRIMSHIMCRKIELYCDNARSVLQLLESRAAAYGRTSNSLK